MAPYKVRGLREHAHGEVVEELTITLQNIDELFVTMRNAVLAEVKDAEDHSRIVLCREVASRRMILLLEPLNDRATAETLSLNSFAARYNRVIVSHNRPKP